MPGEYIVRDDIRCRLHAITCMQALKKKEDKPRIVLAHTVHAVPGGLGLQVCGDKE